MGAWRWVSTVINGASGIPGDLPEYLALRLYRGLYRRGPFFPHTRGNIMDISNYNISNQTQNSDISMEAESSHKGKTSVDIQAASNLNSAELREDSSQTINQLTNRIYKTAATINVASNLKSVVSDLSVDTQHVKVQLENDTKHHKYTYTRQKPSEDTIYAKIDSKIECIKLQENANQIVEDGVQNASRNTSKSEIIDHVQTAHKHDSSLNIQERSPVDPMAAHSNLDQPQRVDGRNESKISVTTLSVTFSDDENRIGIESVTQDNESNQPYSFDTNLDSEPSGMDKRSASKVDSIVLSDDSNYFRDGDTEKQISSCSATSNTTMKDETFNKCAALGTRGTLYISTTELQENSNQTLGGDRKSRSKTTSLIEVIVGGHKNDTPTDTYLKALFKDSSTVQDNCDQTQIGDLEKKSEILTTLGTIVDCTSRKSEHTDMEEASENDSMVQYKDLTQPQNSDTSKVSKISGCIPTTTDNATSHKGGESMAVQRTPETDYKTDGDDLNQKQCDNEVKESLILETAVEVTSDPKRNTRDTQGLKGFEVHQNDSHCSISTSNNAVGILITDRHTISSEADVEDVDSVGLKRGLDQLESDLTVISSTFSGGSATITSSSAAKKMHVKTCQGIEGSTEEELLEKRDVNSGMSSSGSIVSMTREQLKKNKKARKRKRAKERKKARDAAVLLRNNIDPKKSLEGPSRTDSEMNHVDFEKSCVWPPDKPLKNDFVPRTNQEPLRKIIKRPFDSIGTASQIPGTSKARQTLHTWMPEHRRNNLDLGKGYEEPFREGSQDPRHNFGQISGRRRSIEIADSSWMPEMARQKNFDTRKKYDESSKKGTKRSHDDFETSRQIREPEHPSESNGQSSSSYIPIFIQSRHLGAKLDQTRVNEILYHLGRLMLTNPPSNIALQFNRAYLKNDSLYVTCANNQSIEWIKEQIALDGNFWDLEVVDYSQQKAIVVVFVPETNKQLQEVNIRARLLKQNKCLKVNSWRLLNTKIHEGKGVTLSYSINEVAFKALKMQQFRAYYMIGMVTFKVVKQLR